MYSDKPAVLEIATLLKAHNIKDIVLCPGSRNIPLVRTLSEVASFNCHKVTDERSAAFFAIGLALETGKPTVVCCTSGTALLNFHSAVAESFYQNIPLIVISADRPQAWIGQMDGQTLPQPHVFGSIVKKSVALPEVNTPEDLWHCNRLINEAILASYSAGCGPVQINVPISEPFFDTPVKELPDSRVITYFDSLDNFINEKRSIELFNSTSKRLLICGQTPPIKKKPSDSALSSFTTLSEHLANQTLGVNNRTCLDPLFLSLTQAEKEELAPELVITFAGHIVSKQLKRFLRTYKPKAHWHVSLDGSIPDTFKCITSAIRANPIEFIERLAQLDLVDKTFISAYKEKFEFYKNRLTEPNFSYSEMKAIGLTMKKIPEDSILHLGNSSVVRYAEFFPVKKGISVYCNRGTSGIDGSLSTAIGFAHASKKLNFILIGDLSFFYDMNALWSIGKLQNLRILLLNNAGGEIFHALPGLQVGDKAASFTTADHSATAKAWAIDCGFKYFEAVDDESLESSINELTRTDINQNVFVEVFTDCKKDTQILRSWFSGLKKE